MNARSMRPHMCTLGGESNSMFRVQGSGLGVVAEAA